MGKGSGIAWRNGRLIARDIAVGQPAQSLSLSPYPGFSLLIIYQVLAWVYLFLVRCLFTCLFIYLSIHPWAHSHELIGRPTHRARQHGYGTVGCGKKKRGWGGVFVKM